MMIKVGVVGGTGYTGVELLRLLAQHPNVELMVITSRSEAGKDVSELFPNLRGCVDLQFSVPEVSLLLECDLVFFATPNGVAMQQARELLEQGVRIIDLAADFRLKDPREWKRWYGEPHACPELLQEAVYGLPEFFRDDIKEASLVANPGCYPTAVQLGLLPLLSNNMIEASNIIADCKSGVSGAGRKANTATLLAESSESFKAYAVAGHRHLPEIKQGLQNVYKQPVGLTFVPHLVPMIRGIHATIYVKLAKGGVEQAHEAISKQYCSELFVDLLPVGDHPETRSVKGSNFCRLSLHQPQGEDTLVILSVIDNLVKGAAGQAVQNMNLMFNLQEDSGLTSIALLP